MIFTPADILAMNFESSSEIIEPVMPNTAQKISREVRFSPVPDWVR
jgi:hypothetical protein